MVLAIFYFCKELVSVFQLVIVTYTHMFMYHGENTVQADMLIVLFFLVALRLLEKKSAVNIGDDSATEYNCSVKAEK